MECDGKAKRQNRFRFSVVFPCVGRVPGGADLGDSRWLS